MNDWDKILDDFARKCKGGAPDMTNPNHLALLRESLLKFGWNENATNEFIGNLREGKEIVTEDNSGVFFGYTKKNKKRYFPDAGKLAAAIKRGSVTPAPAGGVAKTADEKEKRSDVIRKEIEKNQKIDAKLSKDVKSHIDPKQRIQSLTIQAEWDLDGKEEDKAKESLMGLMEYLEEGGDVTDNQLRLMTLAWLSGRRTNAGFGKNMQTQHERDAVIKHNKQNLLDMYDDAIPEKVAEGVKKARPKTVSEDTVNKSYAALPKKLREALERKGKVAGKNSKNHFLGYIREDGSITTDRNDPNIKKDANGKPEVKRGGLGSVGRGKMIWRIFLEQGGIDAYTGQPLQIESMDLEHVVGFENDDNGIPTDDDYKNREHEQNQVLTSSAVNQTKKDMSMEDYIKSVEEKEGGRDDADYERLTKMYGEANELLPETEQEALLAMDEIEYKIAGGGSITKSEFDSLSDEEKPKLSLTDQGTPKVKSATLSSNHDAESVKLMFERDQERYKDKREVFLSIEDLDPDDVDTIKRMNSKIGKRTMNAMGLGAGAKDPSGRRTSSIGSKDEFYQGFIIELADVPHEDRKHFKFAWTNAVRHIESDAVRGVKKNPNFDKTKKVSDSNPEYLSINNYDVYPPWHKKAGQPHPKAGKSAGKENQTMEFRKHIRNAVYPKGHPKAGQKLVDIENMDPKSAKLWRYRDTDPKSPTYGQMI
jgi:hypothetical protein